MRKLHPEYLETISRVVSASPYFSLLSMEIKTLKVNRCTLEVRLEEKHLQPFGAVHGGVYASLIDAATFWAVFTSLDEGLGMTTVELKTNYLAPATKGILHTAGTAIKIGKTLCLGEATVADGEGRLLAHGTATMMIIKDLKIQGDLELPRKFLKEEG
jgi:uncharacterized protein (TIGR00369 family)